MGISARSSIIRPFLAFAWVGVAVPLAAQDAEPVFSESSKSFGIGDEIPSAGVSITTLPGSSSLEIAFANARSRPNQLFRKVEGEWQPVDGHGLTLDRDSTSALCQAYIGTNGQRISVAINQHGERNRLYSANPRTLLPARTASREAGDNYDCRLGDYSGDGRLDLVVTDLNGGIDLYLASADGGFEPDPTQLEWIATKPSGAASWVDVDLDGDLDLFVAHPGAPASLFLNKEGAFSPVDPDALGDIGNATGMWVGASWADYDNDGDQDVFLTNLDGPNALFENRGGVFQRTGLSPDEDLGQSWVGVWGDYNHDAHLDLYVTNFDQPDALYLGRHGGELVRKALPSECGSTGASGAATGDLDGDGDLDIVIAHWIGSSNRLLSSRGSELGNWLQVRLFRENTNPQALGARVTLDAEVGGRKIRQTRIIGGSDGIRSQSWNLAHFGIGQATRVDRVEVHWPDGTTSTRANLSANQQVKLVKPASEPGEPSTSSDATSPYVQRLVVFLEGTDAPAEDQADLRRLQQGHLANIRSMAQAGLLYLAGPISSDTNAHRVRGILVFGPPSEELQSQVMKMLADDPMINAGHLKPEFRVLTFERGNSLAKPLAEHR